MSLIDRELPLRSPLEKGIAVIPHRMIVNLSCILLWTSFASAQQPAPATTEEMTRAATKFLESLSPAEKAKVEMSFDDPARQDWHNIPKPQRKGLQIREMSQAQRQLCHALVKTGLSDSGYAKAVKIMALEANLKEGEKNLTNSPLRDTERYFLTIFGKPAMTGLWGWSFEGHHLSLNFVVKDGQIVADSPSFWGANPATVHVLVEGGPAVGTRTLGDEEQLAFDLLNSFSDAQKAKAVIADKAPADYRAAGQPKSPTRVNEGLPAKELTADQQKILKSLLETYCSHLNPAVAKSRLKEIESDGFGQMYFAWAGGTKPGIGHYYRVEGPSFVLELVNVQSDPAGNTANHIHSVWRNPKGDFGLSSN